MNIGDKVRDTVSGFRGTITAFTEWQGGRRTYLVQGQANGNDYKAPVWIEAELLVVDDRPDTVYFGDSSAFGARRES